MPNLFFSGELNFAVTGDAQQSKALKKAIKQNDHGIIFNFENGNTPCIFYLYPFHMTKGNLTINIDGNFFNIIFNGTAKIPLDKSAFDYLTKKDAVLDIGGVTCHPYYLNINGEQGLSIKSPLKISKTAPK